MEAERTEQKGESIVVCGEKEDNVRQEEEFIEVG